MDRRRQVSNLSNLVQPLSNLSEARKAPESKGLSNLSYLRACFRLVVREFPDLLFIGRTGRTGWTEPREQGVCGCPTLPTRWDKVGHHGKRFATRTINRHHHSGRRERCSSEEQVSSRGGVSKVCRAALAPTAVPLTRRVFSGCLEIWLSMCARAMRKAEIFQSVSAASHTIERRFSGINCRLRRCSN